MSTKNKLNDIRSGRLSAADNIREKLKIIKESNKKLNAVLYVAEKEALRQAEEVDKKLRQKKAGKLAGLAIAVKANINVKGMPISCASQTLAGYKGTFDADVIKKIREEDGIVIGISNMDEFACGISGETSAFGKTINPAAPDVVPGGSSSGSAAAVAADFCDIALGSDTGGSIRNPASHCGIVGVKPSYGRVSRYGLIDLSMSLDQIGPLSRDVYGAALMMEVISGHSDSDPTAFRNKVPEYTGFQNTGFHKKLKIGLSDEFRNLCRDNRIYSLIEAKAAQLSDAIKAPVKNVSLKYTHLGVETYYPIVYTEFYSATRRLDGRRYGRKIEDAAGEEVLRRIFGGREISRAEHSGLYYRKALAAKELIKKDFEEAFKKVDVLISPVTPDLPHKAGKKISPEEAYAMDAFTIPANLSGVAAGAAPAGKINNIPIGIQVIVPAFREELLFGVLNVFESFN